MHIWGHFKTITKHRFLVCKYCFRLGLYWQGLTHDLSKYSPREFWVGAKYFQGNRSPNDAERQTNGYSSSWLHHKGHNRHHFEYWTDYGTHGEGIIPIEIPNRFVAEMFCDRLAASRTYRKEQFTNADPYLFFERSRKYAMIHKSSEKLLECMVTKLKDEGEDAAFSYIKHDILRK